MADFFFQPHPSCVDSDFLCNSPNCTVPSLLEDMTTGSYPSHSLHESCSHETSTQVLVNGNQFDSISCMSLKAECESFVIEVESTGKSTNRPEQGNGMKEKRKATAKNWSSNSSQRLKEAQRKKPRKCVKSEKKVILEAPPSGYVHVRARRGQATDSHSLAERVRREKISERMKLLQGLVPGGDKVTGKALLLDEIINYVQSLQNQVEFLSMKLASLCPFPSNFGVSYENGGYLPQLENVRELSHFSTNVNGNHHNSFNNSGDSAFSGLQNYELVENDVSVFAYGQWPNDISIAQDSTSIIWNVEGQNQRFIIDEVGCSLRSSQQ